MISSKYTRNDMVEIRQDFLPIYNCFKDALTIEDNLMKRSQRIFVLNLE